MMYNVGRNFAIKLTTDGVSAELLLGPSESLHDHRNHDEGDRCTHHTIVLDVGPYASNTLANVACAL